MSYFDQLLNVISADSEIIQKYPALKDALKEASKLSRELEEARKELDEWHRWADENWDDELNMTRREAALSRRVEELERMLNEKVGSDFPAFGEDITSNFDKLEQMLRSKGYVTKADLTAAIGNVVTKQDLEKQLNSLATNIGKFYAQTSSLAWRHFQEFNQPLDIGGLIKFMTDNNIPDPEAAYERFTADLRKRKQEEEIQRAIEQAKEQARREALQQMTMSKESIPADLTGSPMSFKAKLKERMEQLPEEIREARLGDGIIAAYAARELSKEPSRE